MIFSYQLWCLHIVNWFPGVVTLWVSFPLDQVLEFTPLISMGMNSLDFVFFFTLNHVRWWPCEVLAVFFCFDIGCKEGCVESGVYVPLGWKS